jgi:hypothetical protein
MKSATHHPLTHPPLKITRVPSPAEERRAATLNEDHRLLREDHEALRLREANLREYEARLRALQAEIEAGGTGTTGPGHGSAMPFLRPASRPPFETDAALQIAWEKLHRAREILEAEQRHLRDERTVLFDQQADLKRREAAVAVREAQVASREHLIAEAAAPEVATACSADEATLSAMTRLTRVPFDMARSVFGGKK